MEEDLERAKMEKLATYEDQLREAKNSKDFGKVLDNFQQASKRVDNEIEKERAKQEAELEKALKNRRGQRRLQVDKEKNEKLKQAQKEFEDGTEKERRCIQELKNMIQCEESGTSGNQNVDKTLEKLKQMTSTPTQE